MNEKITSLVVGNLPEREKQAELEDVPAFEFRDYQDRLVFEVTHVGLDKMSPDKIEAWQLSLPLTAMLNEVGNIHISHVSAKTKERLNNFMVLELENGDEIILDDKKTKKTTRIAVSIDPTKQKIQLTPVKEDE